ncbi:PREDICTED: uncharacterized protein LOC108361877 isoform X3 [Rhagoletis zephyria]|uniref:uncharacterized protein LOC108361877 isoform X3 n=1 Tax=Rhagoletis zephyria TaxID=28612 RepID=UPI0008112781|nr:PREDICTED: uncharacterized protein LOC108361877 isoform X3 [Rhagoletis zephyria]
MYNKETKKDFEKEECSENIIIRSVLKYFNENESYLFHIFEIGTTLQEVVGRIPTNTPLIAFVKNGGEDNYITYLFIEKTIIFQNTGAITLLPFLKQIIHIFYVFM